MNLTGTLLPNHAPVDGANVVVAWTLHRDGKRRSLTAPPTLIAAASGVGFTRIAAGRPAYAIQARSDL